MSAAGAFLRELVDRGLTPGVQYAWVDPQGPPRVHCAGHADLAGQRPMTASTVLMAYSMSKVLTAHAITMLAAQGRLSGDDPLDRWVPEHPYGAGITLRHLVEHRSGIPNPLPLRWVHLAAEHADFQEEAALDVVLRSHPRRKFAPGSKRLYSNIGYWLLERVVERAARQPFEQFVEREVLEPLGIGPAEIGYRLPSDGSQASGYLERYSLLNLLRPLLVDRRLTGPAQGRWVRIQDHYVNGPAFGGAVGTAAGFAKLAMRLSADGGAGFGWSDSATHVRKEGGGAGFHCLMRLDPRNRRASVIMSNATRSRVADWLDRLDSMQAATART